MKTLTKILVLLFFLSLQAQNAPQKRISRLDSLKQILPKVKGVQKLQVLADISEVYMIQNDAPNFVKNQAILEKEFTLHPKGSEEVREVFYCNQAYYYNDLGDYKNTILFYQKAIDVNSNTKRSLQLKVLAYLNLSEQLRGLQQFQQALEYLDEAQKMVSKNKLGQYTDTSIKLYKAYIYQDLTDLARKAKSTDQKDYFKKTFDNYMYSYNVIKDLKLRPNAEGLRWIQNYSPIGDGLYYCGRKKEAQKVFKKSDAFLLKYYLYGLYYDSKFNEFAIKISDSLLTQNEKIALLNQIDSTINKKIPNQDSNIYFKLYLAKAQALYNLERDKEALFYYEKAEKLMDYGSDNLSSDETYEHMGELYEWTGNQKKALIYKTKALKVIRKLLNSNSIEGEKKMQALLEIERMRQAKQLEFEKLKSERNRNYAIMLLLGLVLAIVIVVLLVLFNKNLKTKQKLLVSELNYNKEVALKNELDGIYKVKFDIERQKALAESEKDIAKNLHDDLASGLAAMNFFIKDKISFATTDKDKKSFGEIKEEVNSMYEGLRKYIHNLYNNKNQVLSVNEYLYDLMRRNETLNSIKFNIKADFQAMDSLLNVFQQNQLYRIIKETVINSLKYSNSKNINVTIGIESGRCQFSVEDDGQGFSYDSDQGIGLKNINDRVETLGGEVAVKSNPTKGVSLVGSFAV